MSHQERELQNTDQDTPARGELSQEELAAQEATELPDRDAMSLVNTNVAVPINLAAALNVLSDGSIAQAGAIQQTPIDQSTAPTQPTP